MATIPMAVSLGNGNAPKPKKRGCLLPPVDKDEQMKGHTWESSPLSSSHRPLVVDRAQRGETDAVGVFCSSSPRGNCRGPVFCRAEND